MSDFFAGTRPGKSVEYGKARFELPILYQRTDAFMLFFSCSAQRAREIMPSRRLHPVTLPGGRALVGLAAYNYLETTIGSYGEFGVGIPVVHGRRPPPVLPLVAESRWPGFGFLVLHLPVTRLTARDAGRGEWGFTKFVADMRFEIRPEARVCHLEDQGQHILTMQAPRVGVTLRDGRPLIAYSVRDGDLIRTPMSQRATTCQALRPRGATLELGSHPMAESIGALDVDARPLLSRYFIEHAVILPSGEVVESGVAPLEGLRGEDREGTHDVRYM